MVGKLCMLQQHGGPDDEGIYCNEENHLVLGHRRLSLIDLSPGGHQPMSYENERYYITYNGELYNYIEIKEELLRLGCLFKSSSDTEVILAAFATWGHSAFAKFNGMFAFALWDNETKNIYLVRDASGIKPLYYAVTPQGLAFASEVRALKAIHYLQKENSKWPVYLLAYGHLPEPVTTLETVKPLVKGCFLRYHVPSGNASLEVFSYYSFIEKYNEHEQAKELIKTSLQAAVKRHLLSDAPIGVFLSGGLDSCIMAMLAKQFHQDELKTLSIFFEEAKYSEKPFQDIMLQSLQCNHYQHLLKEEEFHRFLPDILKAMDLPSCDGINTWFISKSAKENGLKAVLSGLGGDELFGGYPSFNRMKATNRLAKLPSALLKAGKYAGAKKLRRMVYLSIEGPVGKYLFLRGQFTPAEIAKQLSMDEKQVWNILEELPLLSNISHKTNKNQASWIETNMYMQNQLLRDSDVMSMAHGIEIRVPFLDKDFFKLVHSITSAVKYRGPGNKQLLIDCFKDQIPESIWNRTKMGFTFPFAEWFANNKMVKEIFLSAGKNQTANYENFSNGKLHWSQFMSLLLLNKTLNES